MLTEMSLRFPALTDRRAGGGVGLERPCNLAATRRPWIFLCFWNMTNKHVNISEPWNRGSSCPKRSSLDVSRIVELCPKQKKCWRWVDSHLGWSDHSPSRTNSLKTVFLAQKIAVGFMSRLPEVLPQSMYIFKQPLVGGEVTSHQELTKWRFCRRTGTDAYKIYKMLYMSHVIWNYSKFLVPSWHLVNLSEMFLIIPPLHMHRIVEVVGHCGMSVTGLERLFLDEKTLRIWKET